MSDHGILHLEPPRERTLSKFDRRKAEILNAAAAVINRLGLKDATLAVVAAEIGLNLKSLRYYFKRKDDLAGAAFLHSIAVHQQLVEDVLPIDSFEERIAAFVEGYFSLQAEIRSGRRPETVHFGDLRALADPQRQAVGKAYVEFFRTTCRLFRPGDAPWTADQRAANAHFLISQLLWSVVWIGGYMPSDFSRVAGHLGNILLNGIAEKPADLLASHRDMPTPFEDSERLTQESFLRAATELINDIGYRGAAVDRISESLHVTKGAFYHYNDTRDGLVVACFERTFDIIRQAQDIAMAGEMDGLSHVAAATVSLVSRQMDPSGILLRTSALTAVGFDLREEMARRLSLSTLRFADMLNDGLIDRSVRVCDMRIAAEMVTATINSAQELQRWVPAATRENAADLFVRPLLYGFRSSAGEEADRL
ncbi:TetR/AcrR family transcriptional regulator [Sphingopyxis granuli]|uniref:TetR/AcrR family transcriptional regulator n=1 Tax=Sphingopyxis granuli TaxID=267128 RepID=UPI001BAE5BFA|nr:TetR/AcrR family transcriptional regulator [Sphingopyxis granuli]QUM71587.1 TetR/AcrR family transcriptional regulator [Sphingopyxis granuli]